VRTYGARARAGGAAAGGRPPTGLGHYLRDLVYGALDGVVTTMAVVAGSAGAQLSPRVGVILGLSNLVADGLSMGASNYLGLKSELQQAGRSVRAEAPWRHGLATVVAFMATGSLPLLGYLIGPAAGLPVLPSSMVLAALALATAGAIRGTLVAAGPARSTAEMLVVGGAAGAAAYGIGALGNWILR
jgi:VIT1/CCC1 family predicted Fe2+/Mn2+ transporter